MTQVQNLTEKTISLSPAKEVRQTYWLDGRAKMKSLAKKLKWEDLSSAEGTGKARDLKCGIGIKKN